MVLATLNSMSSRRKKAKIEATVKGGLSICYDPIWQP